MPGKKKISLLLSLTLLNLFLYGYLYFSASSNINFKFKPQAVSSETQTLTPATKNLFLVSIDGLRSSEAFDAVNPGQYLPNLWNNLRPQGTLYRNIYNLGATWTTPGNDTLVDGCWELTPNNEGGLNFRPQCPTMFEYYRRAYPAVTQDKVWSVVGKDNCYLTNHSGHPFYGTAYQGSINYPTGDRPDEETWNQMQTIINQDHPSLVFLHLGEVDHAGHNSWTEYLQAIKDADKIVYDLWNKIQADPNYRDQTTLLVTTDHGRHDDQLGGYGGHSGICEGCKKTFLLALGPGVKSGQQFNEFHQQIDIVPTIGNLLGFETPMAQGKILKEMLTNYQEPTPANFSLAASEEKLTNSTGEAEQPAIAVNQSGLHLAWVDNRTGKREIYYKFRPAGSTQWTNDLQLSSAEKEARAPSITTEPNLVHIVWQEYSQGNWQLVYRHTDAINNWSPKIVFDNSLPETATEGSFMLWEPKTSLCQGQLLASSPYLPNNLNFYRRFNDASWTKKTFYSGEKSLPQGVALSSADKYVYLFWLQSGVNWEIRYRRSENCGLTWSEAASLTKVRGEQDIKTVASGQNLFASWIRPESGLFWNQSNDKGVSWSTPSALRPQKAWHPNLTLNRNRISLVWEDYRDSIPAIYLNESSNNGLSWSEKRISFGNRFSLEPAVANDGQSSFVVWRDNRDGSWQLYFSQAGASLLSMVPSPTQNQISPTVTRQPSPTLSPLTECEKQNGKCCPADFGYCQGRFSSCYYGGNCLGCYPNWCCDECAFTSLSPSPTPTRSPSVTLSPPSNTPTPTPIAVLNVCQNNGGACCSSTSKCVTQKYWYGSPYYYTQGGCNPSGIHPFASVCCNRCQ